MTEYDYSFVICNYNMAHSLEESLDSLIHQLPEKAEIVVIDGGSTDGSQEILQRYAQKYDFFRFEINEEGTLGHDRNLGSELAHGEILFHQFDCDEKLKDGAIEKLLKKWDEILENSEKEPVAIISGIRTGYRDAFLDLEYGEVNRAEDRELGRRVKSQNDYVNVVTGIDIVEDIYQPSIPTVLRKHWVAIYSEYQNGLSFREVFNQFVFENEGVSRKSKIYHVVFVIAAYFLYSINGFVKRLKQVF